MRRSFLTHWRQNQSVQIKLLIWWYSIPLNEATNREHDRKNFLNKALTIAVTFITSQSNYEDIDFNCVLAYWCSLDIARFAWWQLAIVWAKHSARVGGWNQRELGVWGYGGVWLGWNLKGVPTHLLFPPDLKSLLRISGLTLQLIM